MTKILTKLWEMAVSLHGVLPPSVAEQQLIDIAFTSHLRYMETRERLYNHSQTRHDCSAGILLAKIGK